MGGEKITVALTPTVFRELACMVTKKTMQDMAKIDLSLASEPPTSCEDLCAVYTSFNGGYSLRLVFCAERTLLRRLTENMMGEVSTDPEDLEEYTKEYFNVLCGRLAGEIFHTTRLGARFHAPLFTSGDDANQLTARSAPEEIIYFTSMQSESVMLSHGAVWIA